MSQRCNPAVVPPCTAVGDGRTVSMQVTNGLLENAMNTSGRDKFLIDGFPRNDENRAAFEVSCHNEPNDVHCPVRTHVQPFAMSLAAGCCQVNVCDFDMQADTGEEPAFVLFFSCPEEVMERRLLGRNEGRTDDNIETIRKRFRVCAAPPAVLEHPQ